MALTVTSGLTEYNDCDQNTNWTTGSTLDTDFNIEGSGCLGDDIDVTTSHYTGPSMTAVDMSTGTGTPQTIYAYMLCMTANTLDIKSNGGLRIVLEDSSGNQSYWYVGGSDTYPGGWEVFTCNTAVSPNANSGTACDLTDVIKIGVGFKNTAKSKLSENCFWDWIRYGSGAALTITGTNTSTGDGWSEVLTQDSASVFGIIKEQREGYVLKGPVQIGDSAGTSTTNFTDVGTSVVFDDMPVGDSVYSITVAGNSTGTTDLKLGSVVGTGDSRQGTQGNTISSAGGAWSWDSATDIADLDSVYLYGCTFKNAEGGIDLDDNSKTSMISGSAINCGEINPGSTNNGAEILNFNIIDPTGTTNNYGLLFPQTPSAGTLTHNTKNISFITSGTPSTQYMARFTYAGDYTVAWSGFQFFGSYTSSTLWHGLNSGSNADVTISVSGAGNASASEFSNTASGTVTVDNDVSFALSNVVSGTTLYVEATAGGALTAGDTILGPLTISTDPYSTSVPGSQPFKAILANASGATKYEPILFEDTTGSGFSRRIEQTEDA